MATEPTDKLALTEETRRVVTAFHSAAEQADKPLTLDTLVAFYRKVMDPNVRYECKGRHPVGGVFNGIDEYVAGFLTPGMKMLSNVSVHLDEVICEGERAAVLFHNEATGPTGLPYNNSYCTIYRVRNGKIVEAVEYLDTELTHTAMFAMPYPCQHSHVCLQP
jgi:ketosteroid isomerase-like protein